MSRNTPVPSPSYAPEGSPARAGREKLPEWDLTDLFPAPDSPELAKTIAASRKDCQAFEKRYQGILADLDGDGLAASISAYEALDETLSRVMSYAGLLYAGDMTDPANGQFMQSMQETVTEISSHLLFFALEINRIEDDRLDVQLAVSESLRRYAP